MIYLNLKSIRRILFILAISLSFMACNDNKQSDSRDIQLLTDSSAAYNNNLSTDSAKLTEEHTPQPGKNHTSSNDNSASAKPGTVSESGSASTSTPEEGKKGWSKAAQGAVIGGATGAVGGAIISKKKGEGAAIGGAVGAAGGYIIGRDKDKKDGRVKKK